MIRAFSRPATWFTAGALSLAVYLTFAWAPAVPLLVRVARSDIALAERVSLISHALASSAIDFARMGGIAAAIPFLIGVNGALLTFAWRMARTSPRAGSGSLLASAFGLFGIGCAACGAGLAAPLAALLGAGILQTVLAENLAYASVALLLLSIGLLARAISQPSVCPIQES